MPHWRALKFSVATWLILISLLSLLPMLGFSVLVVQRLLAANQAQELSTLERRTVLAAEVIGRELERARTAGHVIALSNVAVRGDFEGLHRLALRVDQADVSIRSIAVLGRDGRRILVTSRPWSGPGEPRDLPDWAARAIDEDMAVVSPLGLPEADSVPAVSVVQPLHVIGGAHYALCVAIEPASITAALVTQRWPADWTATVVDQQLRIVGRSRDAGRLLGQPVTEGLAASIRAGRAGTFSALNAEGTRLVGAIAPVPGSGWWVAAGLPEADLQARVREPLLWIGAVGLALLLACAGGAALIGRELARQIGQAARGESHSGWNVRELLHLRQRDLHTARALEVARHDALTGLPARALFDEQLRQRVAAVREGEGGWGVAALFIDLDGFKAVNDRLGHEAGDRLLAGVADILRRCTRAEDLSARLGGDEFAVLLAAPDTQVLAISQSVASRIVHEVPLLGRSLDCSVGCSIGIAVGDRSADPAALLDRADQAMLSAKRAGKNRVVVWSPGPGPGPGA